MTESETHRFIKNKIASALEELGYTIEQEKHTNEGRLDVYAKKDGNEINIEVYKTHIPNWIIAKVKGEINEIEVKRTYKKRVIPWLVKNLPIIEKLDRGCIELAGRGLRLARISLIKETRLVGLDIADSAMNIRFQLADLNKQAREVGEI